MTYFALALCCCAGTLGTVLAQEPEAVLPADGMVQLNLGNEVELKALVDYVSQRLGVKILYDEQIANKKISIRAPGEIPANSLLELLQSALKMKGLALVEAEAPGWKRIVMNTKLPEIARSGDAQQVAEEFGGATAVTQAFVLKHVEAQQADQIIKPFLSQPGANSVALKDPSILIVTDYATNLMRIAKLVELVDQPRPDVVTELYAAQHVEAGALSDQVKALLASQAKVQGLPAGAVAGVEVAADARTNKLLMIGTRSRMRNC